MTCCNRLQNPGDTAIKDNSSDHHSSFIYQTKQRQDHYHGAIQDLFFFVCLSEKRREKG